MKLAFIAMSGVRAHDPELTRLGLTLPGFVERSKKIASLPSLGLLALAGATPAGVEVEYIEVEDIVDLDGLPGEFDAVAISSFSAQIKEAYVLADRYRKAGTRVILGGLHVIRLPCTRWDVSETCVQMFLPNQPKPAAGRPPSRKVHQQKHSPQEEFQEVP